MNGLQSIVILERTYKRKLLSSVIAALMLGIDSACATGITADAGAGAANQANVGASLNGAEVLNIVEPNGSGLSHNKFTDFNVQQQGLVVNNSSVNVISNIGGAVVANPNLAGGSRH